MQASCIRSLRFRTQVIVEHLAQRGGVIRPARGRVEQEQVALAARPLLIAVIDHEVGRDAELLQRVQHHRRPAAVNLASARIGHLEIGVVSQERVFAECHHLADLDRGIDGLRRRQYSLKRLAYVTGSCGLSLLSASQVP